MKNLKRAAVILITSGILILIAGCNEAYAQKKQVMETQWEKSTALAKLPVVEDMINRGELEQAKEILNRCLASIPESSHVHLLIGRVHFIEGRTEKACQSFQKSVELDPQLDKGWYFLGSLAVLEGNYNLALDHYLKAIQLQPASTDYRIGVCELYVEMRQPDKAIEVIEDGLSKQPNNLELMLALARLHDQSGDDMKAIGVYEQAQLMHGNAPQILEPCGYAYMAQGQWAKAAEKFELLLNETSRNPEHYVVTLRSLATCSFRTENYAKALACYDKLSVICRDDSEVWIGMAQSALGLGDTQRAILCAEKSLKLQPSWPKAYAVLAGALYMKGDYQRSMDIFGKITGDDEFAAFAWFMTGRCYRQMGQTVQAETAFERAERLDPDNELIRMFLKKTLKFL